MCNMYRSLVLIYADLNHTLVYHAEIISNTHPHYKRLRFLRLRCHLKRLRWHLTRLRCHLREHTLDVSVFPHLTAIWPIPYQMVRTAKISNWFYKFLSSIISMGYISTYQIWYDLPCYLVVLVIYIIVWKQQRKQKTKKSLKCNVRNTKSTA